MLLYDPKLSYKPGSLITVYEGNKYVVQPGEPMYPTATMIAKESLPDGRTLTKIYKD